MYETIPQIANYKMKQVCLESGNIIIPHYNAYKRSCNKLHCKSQLPNKLWTSH